jgi:hypothetical protein
MMIEEIEPIAETARSHVETLVPTAGPEEPVARAVALLSSGHHAMADAVISSTGHRPLGVVPVAALLAAPRDAPLSAVMGPMPPVSIRRRTRSMWRRSPTITV